MVSGPIVGRTGGATKATGNGTLCTDRGSMRGLTGASTSASTRMIRKMARVRSTGPTGANTAAGGAMGNSMAKQSSQLLIKSHAKACGRRASASRGRATITPGRTLVWRRRPSPQHRPTDEIKTYSQFSNHSQLLETKRESSHGVLGFWGFGVLG